MVPIYINLDFKTNERYTRIYLDIKIYAISLTVNTMSTPLAAIGRARDALITAVAPILRGPTYIVITALLPPDRPFTAAVLRTVPAGLLLLLWCKALPARPLWSRLLVLAALNIGVFQALLFIAAYRLPGGLGAVLGSLQPLLVMLLSWRVDGESPARSAVWASAAGVVGMAVLLLTPGVGFDLWGVAAALAGAACMAAGVWLTRRWRRAGGMLGGADDRVHGRDGLVVTAPITPSVCVSGYAHTGWERSFRRAANAAGRSVGDR